jgi:hypothetical protein
MEDVDFLTGLFACSKPPAFLLAHLANLLSLSLVLDFDLVYF